MIPLYAYRDNSCDPAKCTVVRLGRAGLIKIVHALSRIPRASLILDPTAEQAISPADRPVKSLTALDCSWKVLDTAAVSDGTTEGTPLSACSEPGKFWPPLEA